VAGTGGVGAMLFASPAIVLPRSGPGAVLIRSFRTVLPGVPLVESSAVARLASEGASPTPGAVPDDAPEDASVDVSGADAASGAGVAGGAGGRGRFEWAAAVSRG